MSKIGFIYKLACNDTEITEIYIGSTKNMRVRKNQHKSTCYSQESPKYNFRIYQFIREHGGFDNWGLFQIEEIKYDTKYELQARERYHIDLLKPALNGNIPTRTIKEYRLNNKEFIKKIQEKYYKKNKESINSKQKIKYICECGIQCNKSNKSRHIESIRHKTFIEDLIKQIKLDNNIDE